MTDNPWKPSDRKREPAELMKPVIDPAGWHPQDFANNDCWMYRLSEGEIAELHDAVAAVEARGMALKDITRDDFPLPALAPGSPISATRSWKGAALP